MRIADFCMNIINVNHNVIPCVLANERLLVNLQGLHNVQQKLSAAIRSG